MATNPASQTLSRGITILELLADATAPVSIDNVAKHLDVHRSIAYRLVRTLEDHRLVTRNAAGHLMIGPRMAALASGVAHDLKAETLPELTAIAGELGLTCFLTILDADECLTVEAVEPPHATLSIAPRPGARHDVTLGAPGKALLAQLSETDWPANMSDAVIADVEVARKAGYTTSHDEVIPSVRSIATPLPLRGQPAAALAVLHIGDVDETAIAARLQRSVEIIQRAFGPKNPASN